MPLTSGTRLGPYTILSALGAGGMGEVYKAHDPRLSRDVAIKVVAAAFSTDADRLHRFEQEARAAAALNHPNILAVYDIGQHDGSPYIVSELLDGETLRERCASPLPARKAVEYAIQVAHGLAAAHEKGIVHRDLKPENLFITADERVKILDFGLAKLVQAEGSSATARPTATAHTHVGMVLGTIGYMAPEQVRGLPADHRADIFAFGAILYEMLSGTRAFRGETTADVMTGILKEDPPDLPTEDRHIPPALARIVDRCLAKSPNARFRSADDLAFALESLSVAPSASGEGRALVGVRGRAALGQWTAAAGMLAVGVLVGAAVMALLPRFQHAAPADAKPVVRLELNLPPGVEANYANIQSVAFSPDGTRVAFIGVVAGYKQVYVRDLDKFDAVPVRGTITAISVFFSPNGRAIGVILANRILEKVSLDDGLVVPLARGADIGSGGAWGPDDRITFSRKNVLWQVPASEGTPTQLTTLDAGKGELQHRFPTVVTGGKALLFTVATGSSRDAVHIEALSLVTHLRTEVGELGTGPLFVASGRLIFSRDGAVLAAPFDEERLRVTGRAVKVIDQLRVSTSGSPVVAVSGSGSVAYLSGTSVSQLVWVSRQGVEQPITDTDRTYDLPRLEPLDGRRVLVSANGALWIKDTVGKALTVQNTQTTTGNSYSVWTPDGKRVVYRTATGLYAMDVDSGRPQLIPGTSDNDFPSSVSRNDDTLIFVRITEEASGDVWALSLRGEPNPHKLVSTPGYEGGAQLSPDGHWLVYASSASPTEPFQLFVSPFPGLEGRWPVSQSGMFPRWTKNGAELVYRDGSKMMAVEVSIKNGVPTFTSPQRLFDDRYLSGPSTSIPNYDVSPDGQRFVMVKGEAGSSRLNIVLNWFDELMRVAPPK